MTSRKLMNCTSQTIRLEAPNGRIVIPTYHGVEFQEGERLGYATFGSGIHVPITDLALPNGLPEPERGVIFVLPYSEFIETYDRRDIATISSEGYVGRGLVRKFPVWETGAGARIYSKPRRY